MDKNENKRGFTIVELLIVIVVIAILAAITVVAFNGIRARAIESEKKTKVTAIYKSLINFKTVNGYYPNTSAIGGEAGARLLGLQLKDVEPSDMYSYSAGNGIEGGYASSGDRSFKYFPWPNPDGSGFGDYCDRPEAPEKCQSFLLAYYDRVENRVVEFRNPER